MASEPASKRPGRPATPRGGRFAGDERLRKVERLRTRREYLAVQRKGRRRVGDHLIVYVRPNGLEWPRLGTTVSKKVGNAPVRNRWKRRLREIFRRNKASLPVGYDIVAIVKKSAPDSGFDAIKDEFLGLIDRAVD